MPNELPQGPIMTTFITTNMKKEDCKLKEIWNNCIEKTQNDGLILPIPFIRIRHMVAGLPMIRKVSAQKSTQLSKGNNQSQNYKLSS